MLFYYSGGNASLEGSPEVVFGSRAYLMRSYLLNHRQGSELSLTQQRWKYLITARQQRKSIMTKVEEGKEVLEVGCVESHFL